MPNTSAEAGASPSPREPVPPEEVARRRAFVAAWVCPETKRLGREVGFPRAVVAATADPARHAARLAATMYAAWSPCTYEQWPLPFDERYAIPDELAYRQLRFDPRWLGPTPLPRGIRLEAGCLSVDLPDGTSVGDLAVVLRSGLADLSYERVARRPGETRRRYFTNRPVVVAPRYALVTPGDIQRVASVDDLLRFRPTDLPTVAGVLGFSLDSLAIAATVGRIRSGDAEGGVRHA